MAKTKVAVIGAGAMGCAVALCFERAGNEVTVCGTEFDSEVLEEIEARRVHPALNAHVPAEIGLAWADAWEEPVRNSSIVVLAVSSGGVRDTAHKVSQMISEEAIWAVASKGWDPKTAEPLSKVVSEESADRPVVIVVGPTLAHEIADGIPTAFVCASRSIRAAEAVANAISSGGVRAFVTDDVAGVEVGAAMKNVLAIAIGMCDGIAELKGRSMTNTKAALFARGLTEMGKLAEALGGREQTVLGLAGAGDLFVTVLGGRNGRFGRLVGSGLTPERALEEMGTTVEGFANSVEALHLAERLGLDLEIVRIVHSVLHGGTDPEAAIASLSSGPVSREM